MKNKVLLLDIDYTIYNPKDAAVLRNKKIASLCKTNFSKTNKEVTKIYKQVTLKTNYLIPQIFINRLSKHFSINKKKMSKIIWSNEILHNYLFKDVKRTLSQIKKIAKIIIYSQGDKGFQTEKLFYIKKYINDIYIHKNKIKSLKKTINKFKDKKIFIIDDWPLVLKKAKDINKDVFTIQMYRGNKARKYNNYRFKPDVKITSFRSLYKIIKAY
jgi:hypothetical protein